MDIDLETVTAILRVAYIILGIGAVVLSILLLYWTINFLITVPKNLARIADATEEIAEKTKIGE